MLYLRILQYLRPHLGLFSLAIVCMVVFAALDAFSLTFLIPFLNVLFGASGGLPGEGDALTGSSRISNLLNESVAWAMAGEPPMVALRNLVALLFCVYVVKNIALYGYQLSVSLVEGRVTRDIRNDIYRHLLRLDLPFYQRTRAGQIISRVTNDVDQVRALVTGNLSKLLSEVFQAIALTVLLVGISWKLTLVAAVFLPPMLGLWARLRKRLRRGVLRVLDAVGEVAAHVQETVAGVRVVKASGAEEWEVRRFSALTRGQYRAYVRNERWRKFFPPATEMITATAILAILWYGSHLVLAEQTLGASEFIVALLLAGKLMSPVKFIAQYPAAVQPGLAAAERALELLDAPVLIQDRADARPVERFTGAIRFESVGFAYGDDSPVLQDIDLEVRAGEVVALVGPSGAGKSTLADLLPRFHDPTSGRITLDGVDVRDVRLADLRALIGMVTQETILFHETVRGNIAYGMDGVDPAEVEAAARAAHAHDFIRELPLGYETVLGERGVRLSGGQRQRIAIARALLGNAPILILDEATSALDAESERSVQQAIDELLHDRTVVVIAHRLSTIRQADQIVVMDQGRIVQKGTHEELLAVPGVYQRLYRLQFADADAVPAAEVG